MPERSGGDTTEKTAKKFARLREIMPGGCIIWEGLSVATEDERNGTDVRIDRANKCFYKGYSTRKCSEEAMRKYHDNMRSKEGSIQ